MRRIALAVCALAGAASIWGVGPASADPVNSRHALVFEVTCAGMPTFDVVATSGAAGHVLGSSRIGVLLGGTVTTFVNGVQVAQDTREVHGQGVSTVTCSALAEFTAGPDTVRIVLTNAQVHLTP